MDMKGRFYGIMGVLAAAVFLTVTHLAGADEITKPTKAEVSKKIQTLQIPFIANEGQADKRVAYYANTFGGTVFVTKEGEIVYSLPRHEENAKEDRNFRKLGDIAERGKGVEGHEGVLSCLYDTGNITSLDMIHSMMKSRNMNQHVSIQCLHESPSGDGSYPLEMEYPQSAIPNQKCDYSVIASEAKQSPLVNQQSKGVVLKEEFLGRKVSVIKGSQEAVTKVSYFKGNDSSKWKSGVSTCEEVNLGEVYDGIDLKLKAHGNNVEKLFSVKPGASPEQIKIGLSGLQPTESPFIKGDDKNSPLEKGAGGLSVNEEGQLEAETELGTVKFTKPVAYQEIDGRRVAVDCKYVIRDREALSVKRMENEQNKHLQSTDTENGHDSRYIYGFTVAAYDTTKDLVIDPLLASTFLGGSDFEYACSFAIDGGGNVYVTGLTMSTDLPTTVGAYDTSYNGIEDVFVSKFNSGLTSLLASTYLGGSANESGYSIAIDGGGNVYVSGFTASTAFPTTVGAYDTSYNGGIHDVFVSKFNSDLTSLLASTFLGGSANDAGYSIVIDGGGNVYTQTD